MSENLDICLNLFFMIKFSCTVVCSTTSFIQKIVAIIIIAKIREDHGGSNLFVCDTYVTVIDDRIWTLIISI
jgi:hypothetical protein